MSDEIRFRSDIVVEPVPDGCCGSDRLIAHAAWVEKPGAVSPHRDDTPDGWRRLIRGMLRGRHTSPFEKGLLTVYCEAPAVVWWEWTRHRFMSVGVADASFSLESGRYKVLDGEFYLPPPERPLLEPEGFKPLRPELVQASAGQYDVSVGALLPQSYRWCWENYRMLLGLRVGREAARLALPFGVYYAGHVSAAPLTWLSFFALRTRDPAAAVPSYPQWEIEQAARACEALFAERWPITHAEWVALGRVVG